MTRLADISDPFLREILDSRIIEAKEAAQRGDPPPEGFSSWKNYFNSMGSSTKTVIKNSWEFKRIMAIPRRDPDTEYPDLSGNYALPDGTMRLRPVQNRALWEAYLANGLFGAIAVGAGKTLITLLLPWVMSAERTLLLVPPSLKRKTLKEIENIYSKHWHLPLDRMQISAYSELQSQEQDDLIEEYQPDLIVLDEAQNLSRFTAARTKRFIRYITGEGDGCRLVALTGTFGKLERFAHFLALCLKGSSPVPHWQKSYHELKLWSEYLLTCNRPDCPIDAGALHNLCNDNESPRQGLRRRMRETRGIVYTLKSSCDAKLYVRPIRGQLGQAMSAAVQHLRNTWSLDGEEFVEAIDYFRALGQLACGFFYRWIWKDGVKDTEWLEARREFFAECRQRVKRSTPGMDSFGLLEKAAERWVTKSDDGPVWVCPKYLSWRAVKDRYSPVPPKETVWVSDYLIRDVVSRSRGQDGLIIWCHFDAVREKIGEATGYPVYGPGDDATDAEAPVIICSVRAQGTGKNLQRYNKNLFTTLPSSGEEFEQVVGRTHRDGQLSEAVIVDYYALLHETDRWQKIIEDAQYELDLKGMRQKALDAIYVDS